MARLLGVDIPNNKRLVISLTYIYGIGVTAAEKIIQKAVLGHTKSFKSLTNEDQEKVKKMFSVRVKDLDEPTFASIRKAISDLQSGSQPEDFTLLIQGDLIKEISLNVKNKMEIGSYEGLRHRRGLPVRGQRTRTNARTRKGPRKTVANKKIESK